MHCLSWQRNGVGGYKLKQNSIEQKSRADEMLPKLKPSLP
jgi:hypothetical protein